MNKGICYGKASWSYEDEFDPNAFCRPHPVFSFNPIRINGKLTRLAFSDQVSFDLMKRRTQNSLPLRDAYLQWMRNHSFHHSDLGEGRAFLHWLSKEKKSISWNQRDIKVHPYFLQDGPKHQIDDEYAKNLSFAINPVNVMGRRVKLYLEDDSIMRLLSIPLGEEHDFLELVMKYITMRFHREKWHSPAPTFLDWVKILGKRPVFLRGYLGFSTVIRRGP